MESQSASAELLEAQRLAVATQAEAAATARWAWPVMSAAMIGFFASFAFVEGYARGLATVGWSLFVAWWVHAIRRHNRATPAKVTRSSEQRRNDVIEWVVLLVIANALTFSLSRISWALVGVALALLGSVYGAVKPKLSARS